MTATSGGWTVPRSLPLHPSLSGIDDVSDTVSIAMVRALLRTESRQEAARILQAAVRALGGEIVAARQAEDGALPLDVSLGNGEPCTVVPQDALAAARLSAVLPALVEDALATAARCDVYAHQVRHASVDDLTGVASRRVIGPRLASTCPGDVICILDLDHFKALNDTDGHPAGDVMLRHFGRVLRENTRPGDFVGRYGGDEFVVVMLQTEPSIAVRRVGDVAIRWREPDERRPTISGGVAAVEQGGGQAAFQAADQALYRAKALGRARVELA